MCHSEFSRVLVDRCFECLVKFYDSLVPVRQSLRHHDACNAFFVVCPLALVSAKLHYEKGIHVRLTQYVLAAPDHCAEPAALPGGVSCTLSMKLSPYCTAAVGLSQFGAILIGLLNDESKASWRYLGSGSCGLNISLTVSGLSRIPPSLMISASTRT
jgi:hypothetical protein